MISGNVMSIMIFSKLNIKNVVSKIIGAFNIFCKSQNVDQSQKHCGYLLPNW